MPATRRSRTRAHRHAPSHSRSPHAIENAEVARIFDEMADLLEIGNANPFRVRAYRTAARTILTLAEPVDTIARTDPARLAELPGIGEDLARKIEEIVRTGTLAALHEARHGAPRGAAELMQLPGIGPARARALVERLGIRSIAGLERAVHAGHIRTLPGFGVQTEASIRAELERRASTGHRMLRSTAVQYADALLAYMRTLDGVEQAEIAGSLRRCRETVGDLDLLVASRARIPVVEHFVTYPEVERVIAHGTTRAAIRLRSGIQVDLRVLRPASFGAGLHYFTGSKAHNIAVRRLGQQRGLKVNEYGIFRSARRVGGHTEDDVFRAVGLPWIPPELRENEGEIEAARDGTLPHLVELRDIRGDLQAHTTDSDGRDSLEQMAAAAEALGYEYLAITDHSRSVRIAGGLDRAAFRAQRRRIDRLNARLRSLTLLAGAEVDVDADGTLDLDDDTLASLDVVVIALHARLTLAPELQMRRLTRALQHPSVDLLAHPSGRILNGRQGATLDLDALFRVAHDHGVMLEIDGQPERLDLDAVAARAAVAHGVTLAIDSDAHSAAELSGMRWGVDQARRGWVTRRSVANARPLSSLLRLLHRARR